MIPLAQDNLEYPCPMDAKAPADHPGQSICKEIQREAPFPKWKPAASATANGLGASRVAKQNESKKEKEKEQIKPDLLCFYLRSGWIGLS